MQMHMDKRRLALVVVIGGILVLGSYVHGIVTNPETRGDVWGGVPQAIQPLYTVSMLLAAAGCPRSRREYFLAGTEPRDICTWSGIRRAGEARPGRRRGILDWLSGR